MAQNLLGPSPAPTAALAPGAAQSPSSIVSGTRSAIGSVFGFMGRHKGKLAIVAGGVALYYYTDGHPTRILPRDCSGGSSPYAPMVAPPSMPVAPAPTPTPSPEAYWQAGENFTAQADALETEWRDVIVSGDHSRDREFDRLRAGFVTQALDQFALSLGKSSDETWAALMERRHGDLELMRIREIAFDLYRLGLYEEARGVMSFFFSDGRWRTAPDGNLCLGLDLARRSNMIPWESFSTEDRAEFTRRCPEDVARYTR